MLGQRLGKLREALRRCLEFQCEGDTLLVTKIDRLARSTSDPYRIISELADKGASFKVLMTLRSTRHPVQASSSWAFWL